MDDAKLFTEMHAARAEYQRLTAVYDAELLAAHDAQHGTPKSMLHLKTASKMAPDITNALKRYQVAVGKLGQLYLGKSTTDLESLERRGGAGVTTRGRSCAKHGIHPKR